MLQCVAISCSVLQCVAVCCSVTVCRSIMQQRVAMCCTLHNMQEDLVGSGVSQRKRGGYLAVLCSMWQHVAACCSVLQRVAACSSVLHTS